MPTLDDVYRKFGEASEAAQLLETELGTLLLDHKCIDAGLLENPDPNRATAIYKQINKQTLGSLIRSLGVVGASIVDLEQLLNDALVSRNRLAHAFYLKHNLRRNSGDVPAAVEFGRVAAAPVNTLRQQTHRCQEISVCF